VIRLRNSILIDVPPKRVWAWLNDLPLHYREWHPGHVTCRYEQGKSLEVGSVLYVEEYLHQRLHRLRLRATQVEPGRLLRYRNPAFRGAFLLEPVERGTRFTAELDFGTRIPIIAPALDAVLRKLLARQLADLQVHMGEEGRNLKRVLEG